MHQDALGSLQSFYVGIVHNVGAIYIYIYVLGNARGFRMFFGLGFSLPSEHEGSLESTHRKDHALFMVAGICIPGTLNPKP